ncbi:MAG: hypothetical protein JKY34_04375 [Kordiimonadaceae bacterium]|nr:hypothetical protein [Kordiimonadaceae bacterium]
MRKIILLMLGLTSQFLFLPQDQIFAEEPIIVAHRGASGYRPEHTRSAYVLALAQGADYLEPDLVATKDGVLVVRHDAYLSTSTNVAAHPEFAARKRTLNGREDWFVFDFTLAEIKTLKAIQPRPKRGTDYDGIEDILTFDELVDLVAAHNETGANVGLFVEMKHPKLFTSAELVLSDVLAVKLENVEKRGVPVILQCFDGDFVLEMAGKTTVPLAMIVGGRMNEKTQWIESDVVYELFYGKVVAFNMNKGLLVHKDGTPTGIVDRLHAGGAKVYVWTIRNDEIPALFTSVQQELKTIFGLGVDGVFADFPDTAVSARRSMQLLESGHQ